MRIEGEQVLVTGGLGFIGSHLVRALAGAGATCLVIDREDRDEAKVRDLVDARQVAIVHGDVLSARLEPLLDGCTAVFHLAASADVRSAEERPREVFENNVLATARLLDAMAAEKVTRLGFTSTSTVYGEAAVPTPEDAPLLPISLYGASKLAAEGLLHGYAAHQPLTAVVWRFANVVGEGATHGVLYDFARKLRANPRELEILGRDPGTRKSYVHIDDIVAAMLHSWSVAEGGVEAYNVGSEDAITVREIADAVCGELGLAGVGYRWTGGVDGGGWKGDVRSMLLAVDKLKGTGWSPRHSSMEAVRLAARELR